MTRHLSSPARGSILILALVVSAVVMTVTVSFFDYFASSVHAERYALASAQARSLSEAGIDTAVYELNQDSGYSGENETPLGNGTFSVSVASIDGNTRRVTVTSFVPNSTNPTATKVVQATVSIDSSVVSFRYGVQVGEGGVTMSNGSRIEGNIFSNGSISGSGTVTGDAFVALGADPDVPTSLSGITVEGDAWATSLSGCTIGGDATYLTTSTCSVTGATHPNTAPADSAPFPISDAQIAEWEATAEAGGTIAGPYSISGAQTLGPKKINGNLTVTNGGVLTLSGPVWVKGNITLSNNASLLVSPGTGTSGAILIADAPAATTTSGRVDISNNAIIDGNGSENSFPMIISTNTGSEAIELSNNASGVILYAPHGGIEVSNNTTVNQITAKSLELENNSTVTYLSGLQNASFSNGPGGSWTVVPGTYAITR